MLTPATKPRSEAARVLDEGRRLYARSELHRATNTSPTNTRIVVWFLLQDAMRTNRLLPDRERSWLLSAERSCWPDVVRTAGERKQVEFEQSNEGMVIERPPLAYAGTIDPGAVNRFFEVLNWRKYIRARTMVTADENWKLLLRLAGGVPPKRLRDSVEHRGDSRNMINSIKIRCLRQIEAGLRAEKLV